MAKLLTPGQVAKLINVHPQTVTRWIQAGQLAALRTPGGRYRVDPRAVDALLGQLPPDEEPAA